MKILLVEDKKEIRGQLQDTWVKVGIHLTLAEDQVTARNYLEMENYDVVLIDLNLNDQNNSFSGIPFGATLRTKFPDLLIVMYSAHIEQGKESAFVHTEDCLQAGADKVVSRSYLVTKTPLVIKRDLETWVAYRQSTMSSSIELTYDNNLRMRSVIETLGGLATLKAIVQKCLPHADKYEVSVLAGGYSGAVVLKTLAHRINGTGSVARNVLKVSSDGHSLIRELKGRPSQGTMLDQHGVSPRAETVSKVNGWNVIAIRDVGECQTLEQFILTARKSRATQEIFNRIVADLLEANVRECSTLPSGETHTYDVKYTFLAEIMDVLDTVEVYCNGFGDRKIWTSAITDLRRFLNGVSEGFFSMASQKTQVATLHGDLHCRNILIPKDSGRPLLIDFARTALYPRLLDYAALEVDLMVRVQDGDSEKFWSSSRCIDWWSQVERVYPLGNEKVNPISSLDFLRERIHASLQSVEMITAQEYSMALLFQVLRSLRFSNISVAKKAFAVRWAVELIKRLGLN